MNIRSVISPHVFATLQLPNLLKQYGATATAIGAAAFATIALAYGTIIVLRRTVHPLSQPTHPSKATTQVAADNFAHLRSVKTAHKRIDAQAQHSIKMLVALHKQYRTKNKEQDQKIAAIYQQAIKDLKTARNELKEKVGESSDNRLTNTQKKTLKKGLKALDQRAVTIITESQIKTAGALAEQESSKVERLARGGLKSKVILLLSVVSKTHRTAVKEFASVKKGMVAASQRTLLEGIGTTLERDKQAALERRDLKKYKGVIGIRRKYRITPSFDNKVTKKQLESFTSQRLSEKERTTLSSTVKFKNSTFTSTITPFNIALDNEIGSAFAEDVGDTGGIASSDRGNASHLGNAWLSKVDDGSGEPIQFFRHAIISDNLGKPGSTERKDNSRKQAEDLLKAVVAAELTRLNVTSTTVNGPLTINLSSVSLVTPDSLRAIGSHGNDEKTMLRDQIQALQSLSGLQTVNINGQDIPVNVSVAAFNFGVNAGAVGDIKYLPGIHFGLEEQYRHNLRALAGLNQQVETFEADLEKAVKGLKADKKEKCAAIQQQIRDLMKDITLLMEDEKAYLEGGNQYEIGAKIVLVSNLMNRASNVTGRNLTGSYAAVNCKSGKDRTGIMECVIKSFASMNTRNQKIPSHNALTKSTLLRQQFSTLFVKYLKSKNLKITKLNTDVEGYKVEREANLYRDDLECQKILDHQTFTDLQGFSSTTHH